MNPKEEQNKSEVTDLKNEISICAEKHQEWHQKAVMICFL